MANFSKYQYVLEKTVISAVSRIKCHVILAKQKESSYPNRIRNFSCSSFALYIPRIF